MVQSETQIISPRKAITAPSDTQEYQVVSAQLEHHILAGW